MKKHFFPIIIIAAALFLCGCGAAALPAENARWEYREYYLRDEMVGLEDAGEVRFRQPSVYATQSRLPDAMHPMTDAAEKRLLESESEAVLADISTRAEHNEGLRHALAYAAFGIDETAFKSAPRIVRNVYPQTAEYDRLQYTGLFLPAGEVVTAEIPEEFARAGVKLVLNANRPDVSRYSDYTRLPRLYCEYALDGAATAITHPFGGVVDLFVPAGVDGVKVTLRGCVRLGLYRLGADGETAWQSLKDNPVGVAAVDFGAGMAYLDRALLPSGSAPTEALYWWNSVLRRMGELSDCKRQVRLYSDTAEPLADAASNAVSFDVSSSADFLNASALKHGNCLNVLTSVSDLYGGISGADKTTRSAAFFITGAAEKEFTSRRINDSAAEASAALASIAAKGDKTDYALLASTDKAGLYVVLAHSFGAEKTAQLLRNVRAGEPYADALAQRKAFALFAANLFQKDFTEFFRLYKLNLDADTETEMQSYGYEAFYPIANKYASGVQGLETRNDYELGASTATVDFSAASVDPFGAYRLYDVRCDRDVIETEGKYEVSLADGKRAAFTLEYVNIHTGEKVVLSGAFARETAFAPVYLPLDNGAKSADGLSYVNPRSSQLKHRGKWVCVCGGVYAGGETLCGKKGAAFTYRFYADSIAIETQKGAPAAQIKVRIDGGKYVSYEVGGAADNNVLTIGGLEMREHTVDVKVTSGSLYFKALALDSNLYATDFSDFSALFAFSRNVYKDSFETVATVLWVTIPLLFAAIVVLVLFAVVFPAVNRKTGGDLPCLTLRLGRASARRADGNDGDEQVRAGTGKGSERQSKGAKGQNYALDWDDNWVKEVVLPPVTHAEKPAEKVVSPVLVANAPFVTEVEKAADFVRAEVSRKAAEEKTEQPPKPVEKQRVSLPPRAPSPPPKPLVRAELKPVRAPLGKEDAPVRAADVNKQKSVSAANAYSLAGTGKRLLGGSAVAAQPAEKSETPQVSDVPAAENTLRKSSENRHASDTAASASPQSMRQNLEKENAPSKDKGQASGSAVAMRTLVKSLEKSQAKGGKPVSAQPAEKSAGTAQSGVVKRTLIRTTSLRPVVTAKKETEKPKDEA